MNSNAESQYFNLAGEAEARLAESRRNFSDAQRREAPPWEGFASLKRPAPLDQQIILGRDGKTYRLEPAQ